MTRYGFTLEQLARAMAACKSDGAARLILHLTGHPPCPTCNYLLPECQCEPRSEPTPTKPFSAAEAIATMNRIMTDPTNRAIHCRCGATFLSAAATKDAFGLVACPECGEAYPPSAPPGETVGHAVCGDVQAGRAIVVCECGLFREYGRPHGYAAS